jgi:hypothetical protein
MPLVLAINYGEYDPNKYLELLVRAYDAIAEGLGPSRGFLKPRRRTPVRISQGYHQVSLAFAS